MAEKKPLSLATSFKYTPETRVITAGDQLEIGPSDLVFFQSMPPGPKTTFTFVVLRRINPE